jgi:RhoGEF domain
LVLRYIYKHRFSLDLSLQTSLAISDRKTNEDIFPGCEDIYNANQTLLYDELKSRQSVEGPWMSSLWDIFDNWVTQADKFYIKYAMGYPQTSRTIQKLDKDSPAFSRFLEQSRQHPLSGRLPWDNFVKSPLMRIHRYSILLNSVLKLSDRANPKHSCDLLELLIKRLKELAVRCSIALSKAEMKITATEIRASLVPGKASSMLSADAEIEYDGELVLKEDRTIPWLTNVRVLVLGAPNPGAIILKEGPKTIRGVSESPARMEEIRVVSLCPNSDLNCPLSP